MKKTLILIDTFGLVFRFFFALPPLSTKDGRVVNVVFGLANLLLKIRKEQHPDYLAAAFDLPAPTFRDKLYDQYKIHRPTPPNDLISQIPLVRKLLEIFRIPILSAEGFEADDVLGSVTEKFLSEPNLIQIIFSGDKDLLQLIKDDKVLVKFLKKGISDSDLYNESSVVSHLGVAPKAIPDLKGLLGDSSDNLPGVKGIGDKTAVPLILKYGSLEKVYENLWEIPEKISKKLEVGKESAFITKELATIRKDVPLSLSLENLKNYPLDKAALGTFFHELDFISLENKLSFTD
ncbi:MAG: hypothetical protein FJY91_00290 [Candidatus Harrisonbacteria bacterium]|nr:hypothetical protein [Candidatus Harrisonbacteria bacterium]